MQATHEYTHLIGKTYAEVIPHMEFYIDDGDCCGYATIETTADIPAPIDVSELLLEGCVRYNYESGDEDREVLNFVFVRYTPETKEQLLVGYELTAGSGSGWHYGVYAKNKLCR